MLISKNWLQTYFKEKLPPAEKLAELFTFHSFEVEDIKKEKDDEILDMKILPDRACYVLCHRGIARELSYIKSWKMKEDRIKIPVEEFPESKILELDIRDDKCRRDSKLVIQNVQNKESPTWLKTRLESIGQRPISFIVDVTNYVMFDVGQPLHAFDLDKLKKGKNGKYKIVLKPAEGGC